MIKLRADYAEKLLSEGRALGHQVISCHDDLLIIDDELDYTHETYYLGSKLSDGKLQIDTQGYVVFNTVKPIIDEQTRFRFS